MSSKVLTQSKKANVMFISLPTNAFRDQWVCFTLTDSDGKVFKADIVRFTELTALPGLEMPSGGPVVYLSVIEYDVDRLKLANRMLAEFPRRGMPELQWQIHDRVKSWARGDHANGRPVRCVDTGEQWKSAAGCATAEKLTYGQLVKHLNGEIGYKTVKGKKYEWLK